MNTTTTSDLQKAAAQGAKASSGARSGLTGQLVQRFGLLLAFILVLAVFTALRPDSFLQTGNIQNLLTTQSVTILLAFAVMVPLATNEFDMSVGYHVGLAQVLVIGLQQKAGLNWILAAAIIIVLGAIIGFINGFLVAKIGISSFIATLGSGMLLFGVTNWFTGGQQIIGTDLPDVFSNIATPVFGIPIPAIVTAVAAIALFVYFERTVSGRSLFFVGSSRRAAELTGIGVRRTVIGAFVVSGVLTAVAGILLGAILLTGTASVGPEYQLPAFAGAMLGATSIRPGRVNVIGTLLATLTLAFLFSGVQQLGAPFFVQYFFNGGILICAVGLSIFAAKRHRERVRSGE